ncbi:hypothetical protein [Maridesulfovibrio sp. FT414]|uniref:hypothetical protein n=1 Tax=Maridesulfovibrio sp. FT414 TaxID=2979469 RepID=UPI003D803C93
MKETQEDKSVEVLSDLSGSENGKTQPKGESPERENLIQPLFQEMPLQDRLIKVAVLFFSMFGPALISKYAPRDPDGSILTYMFVLAFVFGVTTYVFYFAISFIIENMSLFHKKEVKRRISAATLRQRWDRESGADFINAVLETRLNVYLLFENNLAKFEKILFFHSSFFSRKVRAIRLFDERCFFDLDEVERVEKRYSRFSAENIRIAAMENSEIKKMKVRLAKYRTQKARVAKSDKKLDAARKEIYFFANMMLEMVQDPSPKKEFSHKEFKAIADKVVNNDYIQNLKLCRPANTVIEEFRENLPIEFRIEGNSSK